MNQTKTGRKASEDKKIQVGHYIRQSAIDKLGGKEEVRKIQMKAVEKACKGATA